MSQRVAIRMLGGFVVEVDGSPVPDGAWRLRKARAVVKLLGLQDGGGLHPERLQHLLWPERDAASAAANLRQALYQARRALSAAGADGGAVLAARGDLLALDPAATTDVEAFEAAAAAAERSGVRADLETAVAAYKGELLPEDPYEPWAAEPRRRLADRHLRLLEALAAVAEREDGPGAAVSPLRRAVAAEPLHEPAHRELMRVLVAAGRRSQALEHYGQLRATLARETAAEPEPATRELYRELLAAAAPAPEAETVSASPAGNLPFQATTFVGRARELAEIGRVLAAHRLVTLTGPGGAGKTRLAIEAARRQGGPAWLAELAAVADPELVVPTVANALGVDLRTGAHGPAALAAALSGRAMLLVLDNCEHLAEAAGRLAAALLAAAPGVRLLATSRAPLHVPGEVDWRVPSLRLADPADLPPLEALATTDAVRLFCERAQAANARFALTDANARAVADLCWRVDGLPLAIELAAARVAALSPAQILDRLGDALRLLRAASPPGLTRQQTLEATLDWSHELLGDDQRRLFRRLAVFAGGFEATDAEAVACADVLDLAELVDQSLVLAEEGGDQGAYRYRLLEPIRQYAHARLVEAGEADDIAARHAHRYAALAAAPGGRVTDFAPPHLERLERDHDNLRAALAWTLAHEPEHAAALADGIAGLWLLRLHLREGARWLQLAADASDEPTPALAAVLHARSAIERRRPLDYDLADRLCERSTAIHHALGDRRGEALYELALVDGLITRGHNGRGAEHIARAAALADADGDPALRATVLERTGLAHLWRHDVEPGLGHLAATLALLDEAGDDPVACSAVISGGGLQPVVLDPAARPDTHLEETSMHFRRVPPSLSRAYVLGHVALGHRLAGRHVAARAALAEALEVVCGHGDRLGEGVVLLQRGNLERDAGDLEAARHWLERGLAIRRAQRDTRGVIVGLNALGVVAGREGDRERAERILTEPLRMAEAHADGPGLAGCCMAHADVATRAGDPATSLAWVERPLTGFYARTDLPSHAAWMHVQGAHDALALGDRATAARHVERARADFAVSCDVLGPACCDALERRSGGVDATLTAC